MPRILLQRYCVLNPDNSSQQTEVFYDTASREAGTYPATISVTATTFTCSPYQIANNTELERYCAFGNMRVVKADSIPGTYRWDDLADITCAGQCDLYLNYTGTANTTTNTSTDGMIFIEADSSKTPISCYITNLGIPTSTTQAASGITQFRYENVPAGSYVAQLIDFGNCRLNTPTLVVGRGAAPGAGGTGVPVYDWLKYEYIYNGRNIGQIQGLAWDKTTKQVITVNPINLTYADFYQYTPQYLTGSIVSYIRNGDSARQYYRAKVDMIGTSDTKRPYPDANGVAQGFWEQLTHGPQDQVGYVKFFVTASREPYPNPPQNFSPFYSSPAPISGGYWYYNAGDVMRYDWNGFYKAKMKLQSNNFPNGLIPAPTIGADNQYWEKVAGYGYFYYAIPEAEVIDQYQIGTINRRVRFHIANPTIPNDSDRIIFDDTTPVIEAALGDLRVVDIIKTDVDDQSSENGSVWINAISPSMPIRYHMRAGVRAGYIQDNETGIFENLYAGDYIVDIYDANDRYVTAEFRIENRYRERWKLSFDDRSSVATELRIYQRDWNGPVTNVCGTDEPVILSWDTGGDPAGYLPESVGANLEFNVYTSVAQQFVDTVLADDRNHRVDYYRAGVLQFRGYIDATTYSERMLGAGQKVTILATDGLGKLKSTKFINHLRERQEGRTSMLSIILKCLSYCDVNLPLMVGINLRDRLMSATGDPLAEAYVHRNASNKKDGKVITDEDIVDARTVLDNILRCFNAFLFQSDGYWRIISLNEVYTSFATRTFSPAGTLLVSEDSTAPTLRVLESRFATASNEVFWINAVQNRTTVAAADSVKAVVELQLESNLFRNGDFVEWSSDNSRPLYWSKEGSIVSSRAKGEKAKEFAVRVVPVTATSTANFLLSPPVPHLTGQDEDAMQLEFRAIVDPLTANPADILVTQYFQILCDGVPFGQNLAVEMNSKDKWKTYTVNLSLGMPGAKVRVKLLEPVIVGSSPAQVRFNHVALSIQPGAVDWSEQTTDYFYATNPVTTNLELKPVELVHADLPLLPSATGNPLPPVKMDVYAWRHAISLADFTATTGWKRPSYPSYTALLDNAAQDRLSLRASPVAVVSGEVAGPGFSALRVGMMLDMPQDTDGRFLIVSCFKNERKGIAKISCQRLADGSFGGVEPDLPNKVRIATKNGRVTYRIVKSNGDELFRISERGEV
ncbi:hypothetical protein [Hymenobacter sp. APR13]|uniref:hypothetical protein n=1 Tax=Hymenobacter sp. APR13 TaxID=1356852 RepID=UPI000B0B3385|nr:hypothetical protein [Hymenobacter sp. APR13]